MEPRLLGKSGAGGAGSDGFCCPRGCFPGLKTRCNHESCDWQEGDSHCFKDNEWHDGGFQLVSPAVDIPPVPSAASHV